MKKFYFLVAACLFFIINAKSQQLIKAEYFFDNDPGLGNGFNIAIPTDDSISVNNIAVNAVGLTKGYHWLYIRTKDNDNNWSHCRRQRIYVFDNSPVMPINDSVKLLQAEYWVDAEPISGPGRLININLADSINYYDSVPVSACNPGIES